MTHALLAQQLNATDLGEAFRAETLTPGMKAEYEGVLTTLAFETEVIGTMLNPNAHVRIAAVHVTIGDHDLSLSPDHRLLALADPK